MSHGSACQSNVFGLCIHIDSIRQFKFCRAERISYVVAVMLLKFYKAFLLNWFYFCPYLNQIMEYSC